jgi:hypothetical protein
MATWSLGVLAALDLAAAVTDYGAWGAHTRVAAGDLGAVGDASRAETRQAIVAFLTFLVFIPAAVFFIRWFHRAYKNLRGLGAPQRYGEGWAIGAWFVPFLNLVRPKLIANDIWRGSDPQRPHDAPTRDAPVPAVLAWWWAAFLVSSWVDNFAARALFRGNDAAALRDADLTSLVGDVLDVVSALLAILVVRAVTARQEERATRRGEATAAA